MPAGPGGLPPGEPAVRLGRRLPADQVEALIAALPALDALAEQLGPAGGPVSQPGPRPPAAR